MLFPIVGLVFVVVAISVIAIMANLRKGLGDGRPHVPVLREDADGVTEVRCE